jgi:hypothetical protein
MDGNRGKTPKVICDGKEKRKIKKDYSKFNKKKNYYNYNQQIYNENDAISSLAEPD